jgi:hypothetical protein
MIPPMDAKGNLHILEGTEAEQKAEAMRKGLVQVPPEEVETVNAMSTEERRAWLRSKLAKGADELTKSARRKLRNSMKKRRKQQRQARKRGR